MSLYLLEQERKVDMYQVHFPEKLIFYVLQSAAFIYFLSGGEGERSIRIEQAVLL